MERVQWKIVIYGIMILKYILRNTNWNSFGSVETENVMSNLIINYQGKIH
jgi:hypothetical protein